MTKSLHRALDHREGWESQVDLDPCTCKELEYQKTVSHLNFRCFADAVRRPFHIVYSDASAVGSDVLLLLPLTTCLFCTKTRILHR